MHLAGSHPAPCATLQNEDLGTGVLLCRGGHGRLRPGLRAFHALLGGDLLAFEWGGGGNSNLGAKGGGGAQEGKEAQLRPPHHHEVLGRPAQAININNAEHIVHKTGTHWDEGHIGNRTSVLHRELRDVQALKTTRPTVLLESQGAVLGG